MVAIYHFVVYTVNEEGERIYVYKKDIKLAKAYDNVYIISDSRLQITIIVNKM